MKKLQYGFLALCLSATALMAQNKTAKLEQLETKTTIIEKSVTVSPTGTNATTAIATYDFTTSATQYYGGPAACKFVGMNGLDSVFAMVAGETNNSGVITNADKDIIDSNIDATGYLVGDTNLSGVVTNADKDFIDGNIDKTSKVPN